MVFSDTKSKIKKLREEGRITMYLINMDKDNCKRMNLNSLDYEDFESRSIFTPKIFDKTDAISKRNSIILNKKVDNSVKLIDLFNNDKMESEDSTQKNNLPADKLKLIKKATGKGQINSINICHQSDLKRKLEELKITSHNKELSNIMHTITEENEIKKDRLVENLRITSYAKVNLLSLFYQET